MGANAQTAVPAFTAGQVLTAAQQTQINTGIPVFATTVTRDAAFDGAGEKVLAEGQFAYIEATNTTQYYDGAAWQPVGASSGLTLVSATTIGTTVSSVTISSAFSATYDSYKIVITGGISTSNNTDLDLQLGSTVTGYNNSFVGTDYGVASASFASSSNNSKFAAVGFAITTGLNFSVELHNPFLATRTFMTANQINTSNSRAGQGYLANSTSYTAFTITVGSGTITGGTIRVYGYANS